MYYGNRLERRQFCGRMNVLASGSEVMFSSEQPRAGKSAQGIDFE